MGSIHLVIDSALPHLDLKESIVSPSSVPGVGTEPIVEVSLLSPSNNLDCMSTKKFSRFMLVDSALITHEILVN